MPTGEIHPHTQTRHLLLQLIKCLQQDLAERADCGLTESAQMDGSAKQVVLELCSDGFVYVLTRCPSSHAVERNSLSQREKEIIRLVCSGLPNKAISDVLEISQWTVATYLKRIFAKLAVGSRAEMVARVLQEGLLDQSDGRYQ